MKDECKRCVLGFRGPIFVMVSEELSQELEKKGGEAFEVHLRGRR